MSEYAGPIFRETQLASAKPDAKTLKIYDWTADLTAENKGFIEHYYPTKAKEKLIMKLQYGKRNLIGLVGLQGTGKTTLLLYLANLGEKTGRGTKYIKWTRDWFRREIGWLSGEKYHNVLRTELVYLLQDYASAFKVFPGLGCVPHFGHIADARDRYDIGAVKVMLGKRRVKELEEECVIDELRAQDAIFIDLPDYTKTDRRMMTADLDEVQRLWMKVQAEGETDVSLVIAFQKELFKGHFFFGKLDVVNIDLLKPSDLAAAYKLYWQESYPFTEDALLLVAQSSRGVFRRFLKYLKLCLEEAKLKPPITVETVKSAITLEEQLADMDLELADVFPNREQKMEAVKLLSFLREEKEMNQQQLAEAINISEMSVSRIVRKLEAYNYIKRKRGEHRQFIISLPA